MRRAASDRCRRPPGVEAIIAVASGKGGVGKSTTAVNLALGLRDLGLKVGMLDADIYGPSLPKLLAIRSGRRRSAAPGSSRSTRYGLTVMSIGFLIDEETPMIWRGPMVMSALTQMLREVEWGTLDVMVVDMPPGTGDAQLTMAQQVPLKGAVIVSTPQDLALIDARRGIAMFKRVNVPVLGIVENMSYFLCPQCGERSDIFGHGGARHEAERLGVPFLGEVPLHMTIREKSDAGLPVVATEPDGPHAKIYREIAARVRDQLKRRGGGPRGAEDRDRGVTGDLEIAVAGQSSILHPHPQQIGERLRHQVEFGASCPRARTAAAARCRDRTATRAARASRTKLRAQPTAASRVAARHLGDVMQRGRRIGDERAGRELDGVLARRALDHEFAAVVALRDRTGTA